MYTVVSKFKNSFSFIEENHSRGIGIECEIPVVTKEGKAVDNFIIQEMFLYLEEKGFTLEKDCFSKLITSASRISKNNLGKFDFYTNSITTDVGFSIIELVLAPQDNLYDIQDQLSELLVLLIIYFDRKQCLLLGYGIQPITSPSAKLLMPKERYCFFKLFSKTNRIVPKSEGMDSDLLNITASNQCHIEIGLKDALVATNTLNALSGLQIALHSNSPIWNGNVDTVCKTNREMFWEKCFEDRLNQVGIPPMFKTIEEYVYYLLDFKPLLVKREEGFLKIKNKETFRDFLLSKTSAIGTNLNGEEVSVTPKLTDMQYLIPFSWFNARLVPKYGTIESRMCCQQPPKETLTSVALTLGLIENLDAAQELASRFTQKIWQNFRKEAINKAFDAQIDGMPVIHLLSELLDIAFNGLKKRNLNEEVFLKPLYERLERQTSPADVAIEVFKNGGMELFLDTYAFKKEHFAKTMEKTQVSL